MKTNLLLVAAAAIVAGTIGCGSQGDQDQTGPSGTDTLQEGLTVLDAQEAAFSAAYKKGSVAIYFQALRGRPTPDVYRQQPNLPKYEVDARFVADNGRVFYSRRGGDEWVDPSWGQDLERQEQLPAATVSNEKLFELAAEAASLIDSEVTGQVGAAGLEAHAPELEALREFAAPAPNTFAEHKLRLLEYRSAEGLPAAPEVEYGTSGPEDSDWTTTNGAGYYYIAVHDQGIDVTLGIGRHSATRLYFWTNSAWLEIRDFCNHGTCAGTLNQYNKSESMSQKCLLQYYEATRTGDTWANHANYDNKTANWTLNTCKTPYDALSNDGHNCHDDTRVQLANFVYGKSNNGYQAWCADGDGNSDISAWPGDESGSPECDPTRFKGYNYGGSSSQASWCQYNYSYPTSCSTSYYGSSDGCDCGCKWTDSTGKSFGGDPDCIAR